ncbi:MULTISPECIES: flagellar hook-length control protein FliK [unclassified Azospirillum]|uniref:flagellar hook-length control protein FliK n=1 Tax=unclassified Azospirillum TaxID=2630922 RepID=UPI000B6266DD|nr:MULTISPECIES: flagellar hook-length control protein FliK [unclassified Azospirillum]SNS11560.1 Flagellar hook-length control protein FliK [Azospirillum sp. RU38E]SNS28350.1 Flagellar hook-length control protein FliK [Azospirillum sp. RU37A]
MDIASLFTTPTAPTGATVGLGTAAGDKTAATGNEAVESFNRLLKGFLDNTSTTGGTGSGASLRAGSEKLGLAPPADVAETNSVFPASLGDAPALVPTDTAALPSQMPASTAEMRWQQAGLNLLAMGEASEAAPTLSDEVTSFLNDLSALMRQQGAFADKATAKTGQAATAAATLQDAAATGTGAAGPVLETVALPISTSTITGLRPGVPPSATGPKLAGVSQHSAPIPVDFTREQITVESIVQRARALVAGTSDVEEASLPTFQPAKAGADVKEGELKPTQAAPASASDNGLMPSPVPVMVTAPATTIVETPVGVSNDLTPVAAGKADTAPVAMPAPVPMPPTAVLGQEKPTIQAEQPVSVPVKEAGTAATSGQDTPLGRPGTPAATGTVAAPSTVASGQQRPVPPPNATGPAPAIIAPSAAATTQQGITSTADRPQAATSQVQATVIPGEQERPAARPDMATATAAAMPLTLPVGQPDNTARPPEPSAALPQPAPPLTGASALNPTRAAVAAMGQERPITPSDQRSPTGDAAVPGIMKPTAENDPALVKAAPANTVPGQASPPATATAPGSTETAAAAPTGRIVLPAGMQPVAPGDPIAATVLASAKLAQPAPAQPQATSMGAAPSPLPGDVKAGNGSAVAQPMTAGMAVPTSGAASRTSIGTDTSPLPGEAKTGNGSTIAQPMTAGTTVPTSGTASSNLDPIIVPASAPASNSMTDKVAPTAIAGVKAATVADTPIAMPPVTTTAPTATQAGPTTPAVPPQMTAQPVVPEQTASASTVAAAPQPAVTISVQKTESGKANIHQFDTAQTAPASPVSGPAQQSTMKDQQPAISAAPANKGEMEMPTSPTPVTIAPSDQPAVKGQTIPQQQPQPVTSVAQPTPKASATAPAPEAAAGDVPVMAAATAPAPDDETAATATTTAAPSTGLNRPVGNGIRQQAATPANRQQAETGAGQAAKDVAVTEHDSPAPYKAEVKEASKQRRMLAPQHTDPDAMTRPAMEAAAERPQQAAPRPASASPSAVGAADTLLARAVGEADASTGGELGAEQQGAQGHASSLAVEESSLNVAADGNKIGTTDFSQHLKQATAPGAAHRPGSNPPVTYQVAVQLQRAAQDGHDKISIQLRPHDLGRVDVQLEFNNDGKLRAKVTADSVQTLELLQKDSRNLENALREAGLSTDQNSLSFSLRDDGDQAQRQQQDKQRDQKSGTRFASEDAEEETPATPAYRPVLGPGRVDVRI